MQSCWVFWACSKPVILYKEVMVQHFFEIKVDLCKIIASLSLSIQVLTFRYADAWFPTFTKNTSEISIEKCPYEGQYEKIWKQYRYTAKWFYYSNFDYKTLIHIHLWFAVIQIRVMLRKYHSTAFKVQISKVASYTLHLLCPVGLSVDSCQKWTPVFLLKWVADGSQPSLLRGFPLKLLPYDIWGLKCFLDVICIHTKFHCSVVKILTHSTALADKLFFIQKTSHNCFCLWHIAKI